MIKGIGTDIIEIDRLRRVYNKFTNKFIDKILTEREKSRMDCNNSNEYLAGRFVSKEAVAKALGTGIGQVNWKDIEILTAENGQPYVVLHNQAQQMANSMKVEQIFLSISHSRRNATATTILETSTV